MKTLVLFYLLLMNGLNLQAETLAANPLLLSPLTSGVSHEVGCQTNNGWTYVENSKACGNLGAGILTQMNQIKGINVGENLVSFTLTLASSTAPAAARVATISVGYQGTVLASRDITRGEFSIQGHWEGPNFELFFNNDMPSLDFTVRTYGNASITHSATTIFFDPSQPYSRSTKPRVGLDINSDLSGSSTVQVDFSTPSKKVPSMNGLISGAIFSPSQLAPNTTPPTPSDMAPLVEPLQLGMWRGGISPHFGPNAVSVSTYPFVQSAKVPRFVMDLKNFSGTPAFTSPIPPAGYPIDPGLYTGGWTSALPVKPTGGPWQSPHLAKQFQDSIVNFILNPTDGQPTVNGQAVDFTMWNEPEFPKMLPPNATPNDVFSTYHLAYQAIFNNPNAQIRAQINTQNFSIGGPELNAYNESYIAAFLDAALKNGDQVNFLSWHELAAVKDNLRAIATHASRARSLFVNNPKYAALHLREIHVHETVNAQIFYYPGDILANQYFLEKGGVDRAARSCFTDPNAPAGTGIAASTCWNDSLDGLFIGPNDYVGYDPSMYLTPRSPYWAYSGYASTLNQRIPCTASNNNTVCFASAPDSTHTTHLMVGYFGTDLALKPNANIKVQFTKLSAVGLLANPVVTIHTIPGFTVVGGFIPPLGTLTEVQPISKVISNGTLNLVLPPLPLHAAYEVTLANTHSDGVIFTTSQVFPGNLGGVTGADKICNDLAGKSHLMDGQQWKALIAGEGEALIDRLPTDGPFWNSRNERVADNTSALFNDSLQNGIGYDENGSVVSSSGTADTWTGSGVWGSGIKRTCANWTSTGAAYRGTIGVSSDLDYWTTDITSNPNGQVSVCGNSYHLYCISQ